VQLAKHQNAAKLSGMTLMKTACMQQLAAAMNGNLLTRYPAKWFRALELGVHQLPVPAFAVSRLPAAVDMSPDNAVVQGKMSQGKMSGGIDTARQTHIVIHTLWHTHIVTHTHI
jgi:hypothetical protein